MEINLREENDVKVVELIGNLDTNTSTDAEALLNQLLDQGVAKILVNFSQLEYISSAGLRILLSTAKKTQSQGGELRMCNLNETVTEVFEISGFISIFSVFATEALALQGF